MKIFRVAGVDPGNNGAIVIIDVKVGYSIAVKSRAISLEIKDKFDLKRTKKSKNKKMLCTDSLFDFMKDYKGIPVYLEHVHSQPNDGKVGSFTFGDCFGGIRGVVSGVGSSLELVDPVIWKRFHGLAGKSKDSSIDSVKNLFDRANFFGRKDIDTCDALLIALWGFYRGSLLAFDVINANEKPKITVSRVTNCDF